MTRAYQPATIAIVHRINEGWRSDLSAAGRALKAAGVLGRAQLVRAVEQAAQQEARR